MHPNTNKSGQPLRAQNVRNLRNYFTYLDERNLYHFQEKWQNLTYTNLTTKDLAQILFYAGKKIKDPAINNKTRGEILSHIRQHFDVWFDKISKKIHKASPQDVANSAWVIAALDSLYKRDSLDLPYHIFRSYIDDKKIIKIIDQQQIRYADLWFFGESVIPNKEHEYSNFVTKSILEIDVRNRFNGAGIEIQETDDPIIADLPQAIDFVTKRKSTIILNEVDGNCHFLNAKTAQKPSELAYNLSTIFNSALMQKLAPPSATFLRIDVITADKIQKMPETSGHNLCLQLSKAASKAGAGVFITTDNPRKVKRFVHPRRDLTIIK